MEKPIHFRGQKADEEVVFLVHRHPFFFFKPGLQIVGLILLLVAVFFLAGPSGYFSLTFFSLLPIILYLGVRSWFLWSNTIYILTTLRLIAVDQRSWFIRDVGEVALPNIIQVNHQIAGPVRSILNFGKVSIKSSGSMEEDLILHDVFDPYGIQQQIISQAPKKS